MIRHCYYVRYQLYCAVPFAPRVTSGGLDSHDTLVNSFDVSFYTVVIAKDSRRVLQISGISCPGKHISQRRCFWKHLQF